MLSIRVDVPLPSPPVTPHYLTLSPATVVHLMPIRNKNYQMQKVGLLELLCVSLIRVRSFMSANLHVLSPPQQIQTKIVRGHIKTTSDSPLTKKSDRIVMRTFRDGARPPTQKS